MQLRKILGLLVILSFFIFLGRIIVDEPDDSMFILGKPFPSFQQETLEGAVITERYFQDKTVLVNVWASWCITCLIEHPFLEKLSDEIIIFGVNYKDDADDAVKWLTKYGNFFSINVHDPQGNLAIDLGVTGAPESFLVVDGMIVSHVIGEMNQKKWEENFVPNL